MEGSFGPFHSLRFSLSTRAEKAQGRYQGMKGAGAEPERLSGVCDKYVMNKVQTGARKMSGSTAWPLFPVLPPAEETR